MTRRAPGDVACIRLPGGNLTIQTEVQGDPPVVVSTVDYQGRTLKVLRKPIPPDRSRHEVIRRFHEAVVAQIESGLARSLEARAARSGDEAPAPAEAAAEPPTTAPSEEVRPATLFVDALRAYAAGETDIALTLLEVVAAIRPDDPMIPAVRRALARKVPLDAPGDGPGEG